MILVTLFSLIGVWLNIKKKRSGFALWAVTNIAWCIYDIRLGAYSQAILFLIYFALAIYGWLQWGKEERKNNAYSN